MSVSNNMMQIAGNPSFQARVKYCLQSEAIAVLGEINSTANHAARVVYAEKVLAGTADIFNFSVGVLTNSTIAAEATLGTDDFSIPDSDMQYAVNTIFNDFAGVST